MKTHLCFVFPGVTTGVRPFYALWMLVLSVALTPLAPLQTTSVEAAQRPAVTHDQAVRTRSSAASGEHREHAAEPSPPLQTNVMTVSPERLQAIGVKFEDDPHRGASRD